MPSFRKFPLVWLIAAITILLVGFRLRSGYTDVNQCTLSIGRFSYVPLEFQSATSKVNRNYRLRYFREGLVSLNFETPETHAIYMGGTPVLFIPGNAGTYTQGRAMASLAAKNYHFDWFLADFDEDLSAMHGRTLVDESRYINDAISYILGLYEMKLEQLKSQATPDENGNRNVDFVVPESVIIVGHSMGGIVARTIVTLDNYRKNSVNTVITFSAPHAYPPLTFDRDLTQLYDLINQWWRENNDEQIALVSITGGHSDLMVLPDMTSINSLQGVNALSYEIPGVSLGIDHIAVTWCAELRAVVIGMIEDIADHSSSFRTLPYEKKLQIVENKLKESPSNQLTGMRSRVDVVNVSHDIMWGGAFTSKHVVKGPTHFLLPSSSSVISYKVRANGAIKLAHNASDAYRFYGQKEPHESTTVMWYGSGPYVAQPHSGPPRLAIIVEPQTLADQPDGVTVDISVDWGTSLVNIFLHYRTLAACWPFALVVLCVVSCLANANRPMASFGRTLVGVVTDKWYWWLSAFFVPLHLLLISPLFRSLARAVQFPSEAHNVASLSSVGFSVHDLFLGLYDPYLFWIAPVLLAIACLFVCIICVVSQVIITVRVFITTKLHQALQRSKPATRAATPSSPTDPEKLAETSLISKFDLKSIAKIVLLSTVLYIVPYQCCTVFLAVAKLLITDDVCSFDFAFSQLLAWAAVVDSPVVVVWAKNLNTEWIWAFATMRNVASTLPLAIYVLGGRRKLEFHNWWSRTLTMLLLCYMAMYAILYAGLHAFMLHHLINYFALWLLVLQIES